MKLLKGFILSAIAISMLVACGQMGNSQKEVKLNNTLDSVCYAIGIDVASNLQKSGFDEINTDAIAKGFNDVFDSTETLVNPEDANRIVMEYFNKKRTESATKNLTKAEDFLKENGAKEGIITTESGLQYKVITQGTGPMPEKTNKVKVNYRGTLIDGTEFDASPEGQPAEFNANRVIKGWTEALTLMPVGSKWMLYIHPELAYGERPRQGGPIQANDALIFEVELVDIIVE